MVGIILATHGNFATGIQQSASMIFGEQPNVAAVTLQPNEGPDDVRKKMEEAVASFEDPQQVLILVDLWGGTPFNQANGLIAGHEDTWAIVAGLNLPMLIDAYASRMMMDTAQELAVQISGSAKEGVRIYPESLEPKEEKSSSGFRWTAKGCITGRNCSRRWKDQICACTYRFPSAPWTGSNSMDKDYRTKQNYRCI